MPNPPFDTTQEAGDDDPGEDFIEDDESGAALSPRITAQVHNAEELLQDRRVQAFLGALADGESNGRYNALVGGGTFGDISRHPNIYVPNSKSDAAGAYQFKHQTWSEQAGRLGLNDFLPHSQDLAAVDLLNRLGAVSKLFTGDVDGAVFSAARRWESLPSLDKFKNAYYSRLF